MTITAIVIIKDGKFYNRGATLLHGFPHSQRNTIIFPATDVCLHVMEYSEDHFL
jgi:hypothetical protein